MRSPAAGDSGDIVVGWLVRLVAVIAVVGVLGFDGISVGVAELATTDQAATASREAAARLVQGATPQAAYDAALSAVVAVQPQAELPVDGFAVGADRSVTVTVRREVATLVLQHVPGSESWLVVSATSTRAAG